MSELIIKNHLIDEPIINILNTLKSELNDGRLSKIEPKGDEIRITCPFHKGGMENRPSAGIYCGDDPEKEYGTFNCFTCGSCGPLYHFVGLFFDLDDEFGKDWLVERFGKVIGEEISIDSEIDLNNLKVTKPTLNESDLDLLQTWHPYMGKRKLSAEICNKFKIKYDSSDKSVVFPVWDENNKLVMLTRRSVNTKKFLIPPGVEKPIYLYNFIKYENIDSVIVCESQINALYSWTLGRPAIATFGCNMSPKQFSILNKSSIRNYCLAFDGDNAGRKGINKFINNIRNDVFVDVLILPDGKDLNDLSLEEIRNLEVIDKFEWKRRYVNAKN